MKGSIVYVDMSKSLLDSSQEQLSCASFVVPQNEFIVGMFNGRSNASSN